MFSYCLNCKKRITPQISGRRFCLECGIKFYKIIRLLNRINQNLKIWRDIR